MKLHVNFFKRFGRSHARIILLSFDSQVSEMCVVKVKARKRAHQDERTTENRALTGGAKSTCRYIDEKHIVTVNDNRMFHSFFFCNSLQYKKNQCSNHEFDRLLINIKRHHVHLSQQRNLSQQPYIYLYVGLNLHLSCMGHSLPHPMDPSLRLVAQ